MNKKGFLLIECLSALFILMSLMGLYAWYFWQNLALQADGLRQLTNTTSMSNASEQLIAHNSLSVFEHNTLPIKCHRINQLPITTGLWASWATTNFYALYELSMDVHTVQNKQEKLAWYVGMIIKSV